MHGVYVLTYAHLVLCVVDQVKMQYMIELGPPRPKDWAKNRQDDF